MPAAVSLLLTAVAAGALFLALAPLIRVWWTYRGPRIAIRPETQEPAAVEVDPIDAAFMAFLKTWEIQPQSCSRWPEKADCGQECLSQIAAAPDDCLIRSALAQWYEGMSCALCSKGLPTDFGRHKPALLNSDRITFEWADLHVEDLPEILATYQPVCWDCHIIETLYRMHPKPINEREPHKRSRA